MNITKEELLKQKNRSFNLGLKFAIELATNDELLRGVDLRGLKLALKNSLIEVDEGAGTG